jgi:SAM-dependent methyltransferase
VGEALSQVFGWQLLQIGVWGDDHGLISQARTQQKSVLAGAAEKIIAPHTLKPAATASSTPMLSSIGVLQSRADAMGIASDSVDAVLLPHTLERVPDPHAVLREVERIIMGDGHLIVLGFKPFSAWGLRHLFAGNGFPPGIERPLGEWRVRDWLKLLGFEIVDARHYLFTMPFGKAASGTQHFFETAGAHAWPLLAGAYMLKARKRVYTMTPIRLRWKSRTGVVGGLVEPAARREGGH